MKFSALQFLFFYIILVLACSKTENSQTPKTKPQAESPPNLQSKFNEPILEVTSDFVGMMWINGKVIDIRLFEDGVVEYDAYPKTPSTNLKAEDVKIAQRKKISDEQTKEFINYLTNKEFLNAKNKYTSKNCFAHDAERNITIKFKYNDSQKQISVIHLL